MFLAHLNKPAQSNVPAVVEVVTVPAVPSVIVRPKIEPEPAPVPVIVEPVRIESVESVHVLKGQTRRGDFVHNSQKMGTEKGFRNVSEAWIENGTMSIENAIQHIENARGRTIDKVIPFSDFRAVADVSGFALLNQRTGERFNLASDALDQFAERSGIGRTLPRRLLNGDQDDIETLAIVAQNGLRKLGEKTCLLRTRESDSSIRAFLSEEYAVIDHTWFLETLQRIVPGGLVSHFRSPDGGDSIFFNLLIPDSIRAESDSDYGGMLACGNGETGRSRLRSLPSIFRAICQNGCIWDQVEGLSYIMQVHRGEIDLDTLAAQIRDNLNRQIPLLGNGIDAMMRTRSIQSSGNVSPVAVIGSVLNTLNVPGITREQASAIVTGFDDQRTETGRVSAFDILQGFTKAAQGFDAFAQETTERAAEDALRLRNVPGFFPTPPALVDRMVEQAQFPETPSDDFSVLEPSAGIGSIADGIASEIPPDRIKCVEISSACCSVLELKGYNVGEGDFLQIPAGERFDRILMNPPFENGQDIDHVRHAFSLLKPGGRLVAIMSEGSFTTTKRKAVEFVEWIDSQCAEYETIRGAFDNATAFRSTGVTVRLVTIDKD